MQMNQTASEGQNHEDPSQIEAATPDETKTASESDADVARRPVPELSTAATQIVSDHLRRPPRKRTRAKGLPKIPAHLRNRKPADMPRRPLSAYNIFFRETRKQIIAERSRASSASETETGSSEPTSSKGSDQGLFESMAKTIAARWKQVSEEDLARYTAEANIDARRYKHEMELYNRRMVEEYAAERQKNLEAKRKKRKKAPSDEAVDVAGAAPLTSWSATQGEQSKYPSAGSTHEMHSSAPISAYPPQLTRPPTYSSSQQPTWQSQYSGQQQQSFPSVGYNDSHTLAQQLLLAQLSRQSLELQLLQRQGLSQLGTNDSGLLTALLRQSGSQASMSGTSSVPPLQPLPAGVDPLALLQLLRQQRLAEELLRLAGSNQAERKDGES